MTLPQLRLDLAAARATLRQAKDELETAKAIATLDVTGKNDDERKRAAQSALLSNTTYKLALQYLRDCESEIDKLEAEIAVEEDRVRADELRVREKLADALLGRRVATAVDDEVLPPGDYDPDVFLSRGDPNSPYYAGKPRPKPNYAMLADDELPY